MPLSAAQNFDKATLLIDRGDVVRGESLLREVIVAAADLPDEILLIRARCCLGELLADLGRSEEAKHLLQLVVSHALSPGLDDVLDWECSTARRRLAELSAG